MASARSHFISPRSEQWKRILSQAKVVQLQCGKLFFDAMTNRSPPKTVTGMTNSLPANIFFFCFMSDSATLV